MNRFEGIKPSAGKVVFCSILAIALGALQPLVLIFQIMLPAPTISLAMVAAAAMYGSGGIIPAVALVVAAVFSSVLMYGISMGAISVLIWFAPSIVIMLGMRKRTSFFTQLTRGVIAAAAAMAVAAVSMAAIFGSDLIEQFMDRVRQNFASRQEIVWQSLSPVLNIEMTLEQFAEICYSVFNAMQIYYQYRLVANLICGAIASACMATLWGNWKLAKRGLATAESYRGLSQWRLSANTTWGLFLMLAVGFIMAQMNFGAAQSAWIMVQSLCQLAFVIQFFGALERRMRNGSGYMARALMLVLLFIVGYTSGAIGFMAILGGVSALFGSQGAAKPMIDKFKNNTNGEDR